MRGCFARENDRKKDERERCGECVLRSEQINKKSADQGSKIVNRRIEIVKVDKQLKRERRLHKLFPY